MSAPGDIDIDDWFDHHPPSNPAVVAAHEHARGKFKTLGKEILDMLPATPERTLALRELKSALALVNEAIAKDQVEYHPKTLHPTSVGYPSMPAVMAFQPNEESMLAKFLAKFNHVHDPYGNCLKNQWGSTEDCPILNDGCYGVHHPDRPGCDEKSLRV